METSRPWGSTAPGDAGPYSDDNWSDVWRTLFTGQNANYGVVFGVDNELAVTGIATPVSINTGAAVVDGKFYENTAAVTVAIPTPITLTRIDRIVLRANWAAQTVRVTRIAGVEGGAAPAMTQTSGTTYDIPLAQVSITVGGVITVTDEREYLFPAAGIPTGVIVGYAGSVAPTGWLLCYGQAVSRTTYARLFGVIGTAFGVGDGVTTFNLPDERDRVEVGKGDMGGADAGRISNYATTTLADNGGEDTHVLTTAELAAHQHTQRGSLNVAANTKVSASTGHDTDIVTITNTEPAGSDTAHNNVQPFLVTNKIIKT